MASYNSVVLTFLVNQVAGSVLSSGEKIVKESGNCELLSLIWKGNLVCCGTFKGSFLSARVCFITQDDHDSRGSSD